MKQLLCEYVPNTAFNAAHIQIHAHTTYKAHTHTLSLTTISPDNVTLCLLLSRKTLPFCWCLRFMQTTKTNQDEYDIGLCHEAHAFSLCFIVEIYWIRDIIHFMNNTGHEHNLFLKQYQHFQPFIFLYTNLFTQEKKTLHTFEIYGSSCVTFPKLCVSAYGFF